MHPAERARRRAQSIASGGGARAVDLDELRRRPAAELVGEAASAMQERAEFLSGMRCGGCKRRITRGYEFIRFRVVDEGGEDSVVKQPTFACSRDDCNYAMVAASSATAMRPVEWAYLDEGPAKEVVGRLAEGEADGEPQDAS